MTTTLRARETVRAALLDLLTTTEPAQAAGSDTLTTLASTRRTLAAGPPEYDPTRTYAPDALRLAALARSLGDIGAALSHAGPWSAPDQARIYHALAELAAVALAWLDALADQPPDPDNPDPDNPDPGDQVDDDPPF